MMDPQCSLPILIAQRAVHPPRVISLDSAGLLENGPVTIAAREKALLFVAPELEEYLFSLHYQSFADYADNIALYSLMKDTSSLYQRQVIERRTIYVQSVLTPGI